MEPIYPVPEFFFPGTFDDEPPVIEGNPVRMHQGGLDGIDPSFDAVNSSVLAGAIGYDPSDLSIPSLDTRQSIEEELPQWGPPFVKFVDEKISRLEKKVERALERWSYETQTFIDQNSFNTDGSGNVGSNPANAPIIIASNPGFTYALHRAIILLDGATFGSPFTGAGDYWEFRINGETVDGRSLVSGQGSLPVVITYGTRDALRIRDGENLTFFASGLTANKRMTVKVQCSVDRTIEG